ncbi:MAG: cytochrome d ubiquinol oxidase subunit II [Pseudomonadota bacterium]
MEPNTTLTIFWAAVIAFAIIMYVILDGFDLGVGILFGVVHEEEHRDIMMNSVAPVWDGNETWLVMGGGGLLATFPLAYSVLFPAIYAPLIAMLLGLAFRGVAFEYRWRATSGRFIWNAAFAGGSMVAAFAQGMALGTILQGVEVADRAYAGGWWDWLTPFSILTGLAVVVGYILLGSTWLILKTEGALQERAFGIARVAGVLTLGFIVAVSIWTPLLGDAYLARWWNWPNTLLFAPVPVLVGVIAVFFWFALTARRERAPFLLALCLFVLSYAGLAISMYPYIAPPSLTIFDAAAPASSQIFLIYGAPVLLVILLCYTAYSYWVFRGKVNMKIGYH